MEAFEQFHAEYMNNLQTPVTPSTVSQALKDGYNANTHVISVQEFEKCLNAWYHDALRTEIGFKLEMEKMFPKLKIKFNQESKKWFVEQCL